MDYYLPRHDLPLVLGFTRPGLYPYSPGSDKTSDLIPSFSKQENLTPRSKNLENQSPKNEDDPLSIFFSDKVEMLEDTPYHYLFGALTKCLYHKKKESYLYKGFCLGWLKF